jgi:5'/3'-nucleotidase SurE
VFATRRALAGLAALLALAACAQAPAPRAAGVRARSLRILLTNDDGVSAPGLLSLREALAAKGHAIVVVAPNANRSGSSLSVTTHGVLAVRELEPGVFAVDGSPADCVLLALERIVPGQVDLVVSGVNFGQNVGTQTAVSGTVGAAITAAGLGVPAIAVSQTVDPDDVRETPRFMPDAAAFTAVLVAALAAREGPLLPPGVVLNVNHPARHRDAVAGVRLTRQGHSTLYRLSYTPEGRSYRVDFVRNREQDPIADSDTTALVEGYISLTPLDGSWTAGDEVMKPLRALAESLANAH